MYFVSFHVVYGQAEGSVNLLPVAASYAFPFSGVQLGYTVTVNTRYGLRGNQDISSRVRVSRLFGVNVFSMSLFCLYRTYQEMNISPHRQ